MVPDIESTPITHTKTQPSPDSSSTPPSTPPTEQPTPSSSTHLPSSTQQQSQYSSPSHPTRPQTSTIYFTKSAKSATWTSTRPIPILRLAEEAGLTPNFGCRSGMCGTCEVKLLRGTVEGPEGDYDRGILICSSWPTSGEVEVEL